MGHDSPMPADRLPASNLGRACRDMLAELESLGAARDIKITAVVRLFTRADPPRARARRSMEG